MKYEEVKALTAREQGIYSAGRQDGIRAAAEFIGDFAARYDLRYRADDIILGKFNMRKSSPRRSNVPKVIKDLMAKEWRR